MSAPAPLSHRIAHFLNSRSGRGLSIDHICVQFSESGREQIRSALKSLVKQGLAMRTGSIRNPLYLSLAAQDTMSLGDLKSRPAAQLPRSIKSAATEWPEGLKVQFCPSPSGAAGDWRGTDWTYSTCRPGCLDH